MTPIGLFNSGLSSAHFLFRDNLINLLVLLPSPRPSRWKSRPFF